MFEKNKNKWIRLSLISFVSFLILAFALVVLIPDAAAQSAKAKGQGNGKGSGKDKGGFDTPDLPATAVFMDEGNVLQSDSLNLSIPYMDGEERVSCFIGRREGIFVLETSRKTSSGRMLCVYSDDPNLPIGLDGCRVARFSTARIENGGSDLRIMTSSTMVPVKVFLYDNRQDLWVLIYSSALVIPGDFIDSAPTSWEISAGVAAVKRIEQWGTPVEYGSFDVSFQVTVTLQ